MQSPSKAQGPYEARSVARLVALVGALALCLTPLACRSGPANPWPAPPATIAQDWTEARLRLRGEDPDDHERAREALERVVAAAPRWTPAQRALDDLARRQGDLAGALARRLEELEADPDDVVAHYLAGRLEAAAGVARFERAVQLDPTYAWGHHGVAWGLALDGRTRAAIAAEERALALASTATERATFASSLARFLVSRDRESDAAALFVETLGDDGLDAVDRLELEVALAAVELRSDEGAVARAGAERALELIERHDLDELELLQLTTGFALHAAVSGASRSLDARLEAALAARGGVARGKVLAEHAADRGGDLFVAAKTEAMGDALPLEARVRARLVRGDARGALALWLDQQPRAALDEDGRPRLAELADLVAAAEAQPLDPVAFGAALFRAGWFDEAHAWSGPLALTDLPAAEALRAAVATEQAALAGVSELLARVDAGQEHPGPWADGSLDERPVESLADVLDALEGLFVRAGDEAPGIPASPREKHGPFAEVVVPGPTFTARDEARGAGATGEPIPGLAAAMARRGRFAVFGKAVGTGGPDGAVLRLLALEERAGEHLGVPFTGLCAWCDGQDVPSRPERLGASIGGAAIHEGWWVDVRVGRRVLRRWERLADVLRGAGGPRVRATLAERGPRRASYGDAPATDLVGTGGLGDRLRLTVLAERLAAEPEAAPMTLDEVLEVTVAHEEGHLCDRTRFLPINEHLGAILGLLWKAGGRPQRVAELLEYRAQLTAVCVVDDPRIPLAQCLDRLERPSSRTPHDAGYGQLVEELVERLAERLDAHPTVDDEHFLVHQLHLLGPEEVRALAREVAGDEGMVAPDE